MRSFVSSIVSSMRDRHVTNDVFVRLLKEKKEAGQEGSTFVKARCGMHLIVNMASYAANRASLMGETQSEGYFCDKERRSRHNTFNQHRRKVVASTGLWKIRSSSVVCSLYSSPKTQNSNINRQQRIPHLTQWSSSLLSQGGNSKFLRKPEKLEFALQSSSRQYHSKQKCSLI